MATWITHLRLADALLAQIPGLDEVQFAIGSVAPDSGIPDENSEKFEPPVEITHFKPPDGAPWRCADLEFYRRYLSSIEPGGDMPRYSFLLGYFFHLVTDNLWSRQVGQPTRARFAAGFAVETEMWSQVKRDWYGEDFQHVRNHPECLYWRTFLNCAYKPKHPGGYLDFLPAAAIRQNIAYIQGFYQRTDDEIEQWYIQRPGVYLNGAEMDRFVTCNAARLVEIYRRLQAGLDGSEGCLSILDDLNII